MSVTDEEFWELDRQWSRRYRDEKQRADDNFRSYERIKEQYSLLVKRSTEGMMAERDRSKVTVTLTQSDARWLLGQALVSMGHAPAIKGRLIDELKHALAECDCGEVGR